LFVGITGDKLTNCSAFRFIIPSKELYLISSIFILPQPMFLLAPTPISSISLKVLQVLCQNYHQEGKPEKTPHKFL
jgi:hypothetical protein